jgi:hypothetical protein
MRLASRDATMIVVARMERSEIRGSPPIEAPIPDCASRHPGYDRTLKSGAAPS